MAFCSNCGTALQEGAKFCPSCGAPVSPEAQANDFSQASTGNFNNFQAPYEENQSNVGEQQGSYYDTGANYQSSSAAPRQGIQKRDVAVCIILTLVTCGIYGLYWFFCIVNDLNTATNSTDEPSAGMVLLLTIITCGIYSWIWLYKAGEKVDKIKMSIGESPSNSALLYIILAIFQLGFIDYCLIQSELNKIAC